MKVPDSVVPEWLKSTVRLLAIEADSRRSETELFIIMTRLAWEIIENEIGRASTKFGTPFYEDCSIEGAYCPAKGEPWTLDENVLLDVRKRVASKLQFTLHPDKYKDPDEPDEPDEEPLPNEDIFGTPEDCIEPGEVTDEDAAETPVDAKDAETLWMQILTTRNPPKERLFCFWLFFCQAPSTVAIWITLIRRRIAPSYRLFHTEV